MWRRGLGPGTPHPWLSYLLKAACHRPPGAGAEQEDCRQGARSSKACLWAPASLDRLEGVRTRHPASATRRSGRPFQAFPWPAGRPAPLEAGCHGAASRAGDQSRRLLGEVTSGLPAEQENCARSSRDLCHWATRHPGWGWRPSAWWGVAPSQPVLTKHSVHQA